MQNEKFKIILSLSQLEKESITRTLAMMAYNPAIGRVLEPGGVERFSELMVEAPQKLYGLVSRERFDSWHADVCDRILRTFKTAWKQPLSYGQAQKPLNVFLKVYVDWARQPDRELAEKLTPHLHVPLDSLVMRFFKREFPQEYESRIAPLQRQLTERMTQRLSGFRYGRAAARKYLGGEFSLTAINKEVYLAWQELFRSIYPPKPVTLDTAWMLERRKLRENRKPSVKGGANA